MRTVPILAGGILLVLAFGTATAVAATNESAHAEAARVTVDAAPEPTVVAEPVVIVAPVETTTPDLTWSAPTAQPAPEPSELQLAPGVEVPTFEPVDVVDPGWTELPAELDARCTNVVPQTLTDAMWSERQFTLYGVVAPDSTYFPWIGYPADELQIMADHWLTNCTWSNTTLGHILHVDFGAGLEPTDVALLQSRVASPDWEAVTLSTGDVLFVDAAEPYAQFPETQAWLLQGDRWMRIHMVNDTDAVAFAETLLASGLTW